MTTTPQAALLSDAAQNALVTLDGIANANPRDTADFETPADWIAWAKSRARFAADALRSPVAQEVYAQRILKQMLHEASQEQTTQADPPKHVSMPQYWAVDVFSDGAKIVSIGNDWLSGERQLDEIDERTIIGAAQHLLSFVGYGLPPTSFDPDAQAEPAQAGELPAPPTLSDDERNWLSHNPNTSDIEQWLYGYAVAYARAALASKVKQAGELPPLPESEYSLAFHDEGGAQVLCATAYTDDQMHAYARAALAARKPLTLLSKSQLSDIFEKDPRWHTPPIGATDIEFANDAIAEFCRINGIGLEVKP